MEESEESGSLAQNPVDATIKEYLRAEDYQHAAELIYQTYFVRMHRWAFAVVGNPSLAEDVVQDVFEKVIRSLEQFRYETAQSPAPWLKKITYNTAASHLRKEMVRRRRNAYLDSCSEETGVGIESVLTDSTSYLAFEEVEVEVEFKQLVKQVLSECQFSEKERIVVELLCRDLTATEIKRLLGISGVDQAVARARAKFLNYLSRRNGES